MRKLWKTILAKKQGSFNPIILGANLLALWDGNDPLLPADDADVLTWTSLASGGHVATFGTGDRGVMKTDGNGNRYLQTGGVANGIVDLTTGLTESVGDYYTICVAKYTGALGPTPGQGRAFDIGGTGRHLLGLPGNVADEVGFFANPGPAFESGGALNGDLHIYESRLESPNFICSVDGVEVVNVATYSSQQILGPDGGTMVLCDQENGAQGTPLLGDFYYLGIGKDLTAQQKSDWYSMVSARYL